MEFRDFPGNQIDSMSIGPGFYKFVIQANTAYFGPHKNPKYIANLQLRISEIHFRPHYTPRHSITIKKDVSNHDIQSIITDMQEADSDNDIVCDCPCGALGFNNHTD